MESSEFRSLGSSTTEFNQYDALDPFKLCETIVLTDGDQRRVRVVVEL
jgi:hypothetical protein